MIAPARIAAYDVLLAVAARRADLPDALAAARTTLRDERDKTLAADIAIGVQRRRAALDHVIVHFSKRPLAKLDPEVVEILRLSTYQLLHLDRVPSSAVVDDAVQLTGRAGKRSASGLVNAVLRAVSRSRGSLPLPPRPADHGDRDRALDYLSVTLSHPRWIAARWYDRYGFEATEAWMQFDNAPSPLTLRANRARITRDQLAERLGLEGVTTRPTRFAPDGLVVDEGHPLRGDGAAAGWFVVQDEASQLVALLAGRNPGARVLDACAAPGGKATAIAATLTPGARLIACDVRSRRMDLLRRTVAASGVANVRLVRADLRRPLPFRRPFDCVFVDAPCSGLGTLRRDPDIRWRRDEGDLLAFAASQLDMLCHAAGAVAPDGRLIYSTCSSEREENESVADAFLARSPEFVAVDLRHADTAVPADAIDARGHLRTYPHVHGLEAFFGAVFARRR